MGFGSMEAREPASGGALVGRGAEGVVSMEAREPASWGALDGREAGRGQDLL
jgi:hypothetical protein